MNEITELNYKVANLVKCLPPMPETIDSLLSIAQNNTDDNQKLIELIQTDPSLCTELLHIANTSCYGITEPLDTIEDAINKIGLDALVQLVGISYTTTSIRDAYSEIAHLDEYFQHSNDISKSCQILAKLTGLDDKHCRMAFVGGLIHDLGRLIILIAQNKPFAPMLGATPDEMFAIVKDEYNETGMNHCQIGAQICENWNFSRIMQQGVLRHHTPLIGDNFSMPGAYIFVAHFVSMSDLTGQMLCNILPRTIMSKLKITPELFNNAQQIYKETN